MEGGDTMLSQMVQAKTGYISDKLWHEVLTEAKRDIKANRAISEGTWEFDTWSKEKQLEYVSNVMAVYIIMINGF
jgi:hypothetical protein